jgi:putative ABC transport system permease protein
MEIFKIALRNTSRQARRTGLLAGAIAFGAMIIILLNSFTNGLTLNVKENFSRALAGHIYITATEITDGGIEVNRITDDSIILQGIEDSGIEHLSVSHRSSFTGSLSLGSKIIEQEVSGINTSEEQLLLDSLVIKNGSIDNFRSRQSLIISEQVAAEIRAEVGDEILVRLSTQTGQNNLGEFTIAAILPDEGEFGSDRAYAHISYVNELLGMPEDASDSINITLNNMAGTAAAAGVLIAELEKTTAIQDAAEQREARMNNDSGNSAVFKIMRESMGMEEEETEDAEGSSGMGGGSSPMRGDGMGGMFGSTVTRSSLPPGTVTYNLNTIEDYTGAINQLVDTLNYIGWGVFAILLLITMVGITNTYRMIMLERIKEIGTMRAIGVQKNQVRNIILYEAGITAFAGAAAGFIISAVLMIIAGLIPLQNAGDITIMLSSGHLGFSLSPIITAGLFIVIILMSMAAASSPAKKAAAVAPAEALRTTN